MADVAKRLSKHFYYLCFYVLFLLLVDEITALKDVIYAVNAGGESHVDVFGVKYERDPLSGKVGTASDYGKQLLIGRIHQNDQIIYQTERYHHSTFGYDIPIKESGNYVLVLKFCEVYFSSPKMKVFDVVLNGDHTIVSELDIFDKVGKGVAHDEYVPFSVENGKLYCNDEESEIRGGKIRVEFIKGYRDNPKVNAILVVKGDIRDVPKLPPITIDSDEDYRDESEEEMQQPQQQQQQQTNQQRKQNQQQSNLLNKNRNPSGPRTPDPYSVDDSSMMLPVFVAIGAFIPLLFCLCKL